MKSITKTTFLFFLLISQIFSSTVVVDQSGNGDYLTINEALNSDMGDTIIINPGFYIETLNIQSNKTLIGLDTESCIVNYSITPIYIYGQSNITVKNLRIQTSANIALRIDNYCSNIEFYGCDFEKSTEIHGGGTKFYNCIFTFNTGNTGVWIGGGGTNDFYNCIIDGNYYGIRAVSGVTILYNCIFINNTYGAYSNAQGNMASYYCLFYNNSQNDYGGQMVGGVGDVTGSDPLFEDGGQYILSTSSPCIDAGLPSPSNNDLDGTRNDIGLHGGPNAPLGLGPVITNISINPNPITIGGSIVIEATATNE
tara:strand:+ start:782 stop:1711 length:930 start_codon:yes stop_codon:yes gene_type:complete